MDGVHVITQRVQPGPDPAFDRPDRDAQDAGDFVVSVAAVVGEHDGLALRVAEPIQGGRQPLAVEDALHGLAHLVPGNRDGGVAPLAVGVGGRGADPVDGAATGYREGPRGRAAPARIETASRAPYLDENFLAYFLSEGWVSDDG
jgi:hypothetical protein